MGKYEDIITWPMRYWVYHSHLTHCVILNVFVYFCLLSAFLVVSFFKTHPWFNVMCNAVRRCFSWDDVNKCEQYLDPSLVITYFSSDWYLVLFYFILKSLNMEKETGN